MRLRAKQPDPTLVPSAPTRPAKIDRAVDRLIKAGPSGARHSLKPGRLLTGPLRLVAMAGRMMRQNVAVTAVIASAALGMSGVGIDYYTKTRVPAKPPASAVVLTEELSTRIDGQERISMANAHWCLSRLAQADDEFSIEETIDSMGPSLLTIVKSAPPGWTLHPEFRDVGLYLLEATDDHTLPRDDPAVRALVDALYPKVADAADEIRSRFEAGDGDAAWLVDRLAVYGNDVREVMFRVDVAALLPSIDAVDDETGQHHADFFDTIRAAAKDRTSVAPNKVPTAQQPTTPKTAPEPDAAEATMIARLERNSKYPVDEILGATDLDWSAVLGALEPETIRGLVDDFPLDKATEDASGLRQFLRAVPDDVVSPSHPRMVELRLRVDDIDWSKVTERVPGFIDYTDRSELFVEGPEVDDLKQGIGTCYLTNVIASIADQHPSYLEEIVVDAKKISAAEGTRIEATMPKASRGEWRYAVRLFENRGGFLRTRWVPVEPKFPVDWAPNEGLPKDAEARRYHFYEHVFSRDRGPNGEVEIYAGLIEQACAELERGAVPKRWKHIDDWRPGTTLEERYDKLVGGYPSHSMEWLIGAAGERVELTEDDAWPEITTALDRDRVMVARLEGHVRVVTGYEVEDGRRSVLLYDTAPGESMRMSFEAFRLEHQYVLHGELPTEDTVQEHNERTASLYASLAALTLAIGTLTGAGIGRAKRAAARKTVRAAAAKGLLSPAETTALLSLKPSVLRAPDV